MQKNQLIQYLAQIDRKSVTRFCEFAHSPYFNKHKEVQRLVSYLSQIYPDFSEKNCGREIVFQHLFPTLPHDQAKLAVIFTYATRLLEQFFCVEQAYAEGVMEDLPLLNRYFRQHNMLQLLEKKWLGTVNIKKSNTTKKSSNSPLSITHTSQYYEQQYKEAAENDAIGIRMAEPVMHFIWEKQPWLDAFYLTEKLRDACEIINRKKLHHTTLPKDRMLESALSIIQQHPGAFDHFPLLVAYHHLYRLLSQEGTEEYLPTLLKINELEPFLSKDELQGIYNGLQNFCIGQINQGNQHFLKELFGIYQSQLEKGLLLVDGHLPEWHFKNITTTGLRLDEHQWVGRFLDAYKDLLPKEVAENAYSYNRAAYHYHRANYNSALQLLTKIEYTDLRYNLDAKSLLLRTYYDLEEEEPLIALTISFKQFLKRNRQLSDFQKKGYFNLLKFTRKAFSLKMNKGLVNRARWLADLEKLKAEMAAASTIFNQGWLEGRVADLLA